MDELSINDMNLAAYLSLVGFDVARLELDPDGNCLWVYKTSHEINQHLIEYATGNAKVSPREFSLAFGRIRHQMFKFVNNSRDS